MRGRCFLTFDLAATLMVEKHLNLAKELTIDGVKQLRVNSTADIGIMVRIFSKLMPNR
jgi:hypothetical protein